MVSAAHALTHPSELGLHLALPQDMDDTTSHGYSAGHLKCTRWTRDVHARGNEALGQKERDDDNGSTTSTTRHNTTTRHHNSTNPSPHGATTTSRTHATHNAATTCKTTLRQITDKARSLSAGWHMRQPGEQGGREDDEGSSNLQGTRRLFLVHLKSSGFKGSAQVQREFAKGVTFLFNDVGAGFPIIGGSPLGLECTRRGSSSITVLKGIIIIYTRGCASGMISGPRPKVGEGSFSIVGDVKVVQSFPGIGKGSFIVARDVKERGRGPLLSGVASSPVGPGIIISVECIC
ncbi:hypothetical protein BU15DRAFT_69451 [Melanogaster broomeanus]|nr:hypothetical protein BU15DRAFT_69451 [Melanogaster broomeanus]